MFRQSSGLVKRWSSLVLRDVRSSVHLAREGRRRANESACGSAEHSSPCRPERLLRVIDPCGLKKADGKFSCLQSPEKTQNQKIISPAPEQSFRGGRRLSAGACSASRPRHGPRIDKVGSIATMPPRVETLPATTRRATAPTEIGRKRHADHQGAGPVSGAVR